MKKVEGENMDNQVPQQEEKKVWIKCRAKQECPGNYAIITFVKRHNPAELVSQGGSTIRYRCLTCGGTFTIST
jgi:tRNA A37 threonylcarbamoyladenosine synthetase subunit TsaC/SUA5/YrdC